VAGPAPPDRIYVGLRGPGGSRIEVRDPGQPPRPLLHLVRHSPTGFEWGYEGSGPADTARSVLADVSGDPDPAPALYQAFKREVIAGFGDELRLTADGVREWLSAHRARPEAHARTAPGPAPGL
jgi:hypothetical protein